MFTHEIKAQYTTISVSGIVQWIHIWNYGDSSIRQIIIMLDWRKFRRFNEKQVNFQHFVKTANAMQSLFRNISFTLLSWTIKRYIRHSHSKTKVLCHGCKNNSSPLSSSIVYLCQRVCDLHTFRAKSSVKRSVRMCEWHCVECLKLFMLIFWILFTLWINRFLNFE